MTPRRRRRSDTFTIVDSVALVQPAERTVALVGSAWEEDGHIRAAVDIYPVLAVQASCGRTFSRPARDDRGSYPTTAEAAADEGYRQLDGEVRASALIIDPDGGHDLVPVDDWALRADPRRLVACPWPESEDEERLRPHIEELKREAKEELAERSEADVEPQAATV